MGSFAIAEMEAIKAAEELAAGAQMKLNALQQKAAKEKGELIEWEGVLVRWGWWGRVSQCNGRRSLWGGRESMREVVLS